ncbi:MAG TPA: DoxX family protein [Gemmataceae bacterium]|jgi:hypothetical protein|nr:DoxX family protein [Gemmataceae bacterium]
MAPDIHPASVSKSALWAGRILSALIVLALVMSGSGKLAGGPDVVKGFQDLGWDPSYALGLGILEIACAVIYAIPRTAVLGAILVTGYFGGAIATHVRLGQPLFIAALTLGVIAWLGLYLRDNRLRALVPLRS